MLEEIQFDLVKKKTQYFNWIKKIQATRYNQGKLQNKIKKKLFKRFFKILKKTIHNTFYGLLSFMNFIPKNFFCQTHTYHNVFYVHLCRQFF